ncbi:MAG: ribonuclease III domain-containing protein [bacterium]|nr:ribonuclease III domain-containing protein [bacterium]
MPILAMTFTHKSFSADSPQENIPHNERMEFLGDAILGAIVAEQLYHDYSDLPESELTLKKIYLVKEPTLAQAAREIDLGSQLRLSNGEEKSGGREKDAVLADAYEAVIAYLHIQFGYTVAQTFILQTLYPFHDDQEAQRGKSFKSLLQEWIQKNHQQLPIYIDEELEVEPSGNVLTYSSSVYL